MSRAPHEETPAVVDSWLPCEIHSSEASDHLDKPYTGNDPIENITGPTVPTTTSPHMPTVTEAKAMKDLGVIEGEADIPERTELHWTIRHFSGFRKAASWHNMPPVKSPRMAMGIHTLIWPNAADHHVRGALDLPQALRGRPAVYSLTVRVVNPADEGRIDAEYRGAFEGGLRRGVERC